MIYEIEVTSISRTELIDITGKVERIIVKSSIDSGSATIFVPHTTAAITINENYDPDVGADIDTALSSLVPHHNSYSHSEGNSDAHIKAAITGSSRTVFFEKGKIRFGNWQGIFFCEFDGPRKRRVWVKIVKDLD